jgi:phosphonate metabolism protein PhnN/1,5-bisphosphokinase (PRPP-forming)
MSGVATRQGTLVLVVGPSGAGKDSLLQYARSALADDERFVFVRRTVTRASDPGTEIVETVSERDFAAREIAGAFWLSWHAHGLAYGLPHAIVAPALSAGRCVVANTSRGVIERASERHQTVVVLVTASAETLARRLAARGREAASEIAARLMRANQFLATDADHVVTNDGSLTEAGGAFCAVLRAIAGTTSPASASS